MHSKKDPQQILADAERIFSASEIDRAFDRMAVQIEKDLATEMPVVLAVMNGGVFAAVELCQRFNFAYEFDYVHLSRYGHELTGGDITWQVSLSEHLAGRSVLIVDDVLDRGATLAELYEALDRCGVHSSKCAVLVKKNLKSDIQRPEVHYVGVETGDEYIFGCGMDYAGFWRGLPELYVVR